MNNNDDCQMPIATADSWSAEKWAKEWEKESQARNNDFLMHKAKTKMLQQKIDEMQHAITSSIGLLQGLDEHLDHNHGMFLLMAIENLKPYSK